ncbi:MAG: adenosine deaminase [Chloroflexota bacterium]
MSLQTYIEAAPKAELHVHLEGSILPATLLTLARRNDVPLPVDTVEGLRKWFTFRDFPHFVDIYVAITRCLKTAQDYELIAYEFGAEMARQNVRYAEATFTPGTHHHLGVPFDVYFAGLTKGRERAQAEFGVQIRWIFDIVRESQDSAHPEYTLSAAIAGMQDGVVALGLGGSEAAYPPDRFAPWFERARAAGLHSIPHAGELGGPAGIWAAIRLLGAERIGHGVHAIEDPELVDYLREYRIPLEVCPTSNICLGIYPDYSAHPFRRLHDAGVPVIINSDDPPLFNTTLNKEAALLAAPFDFNVETIDDILLNGVRYSCLPAGRKAAMLAALESELQSLKEVHLA